MRLNLWAMTLVVGLAAVAVQAQEGPQRGKIKAVNDDRVTITVDGKDVECAVSPQTRIMGPDGADIASPLPEKGVKPGAAVMFMARQRDGRSTLVGMKLVPEGQKAGRGGGGGEIRRGKIKALDLEQKQITITADGKEEKFELADETRVLGASGNTLRERFQGIKPDMEVNFRALRRDGKVVLEGIRPFDGRVQSNRPLPPHVDASKLVPLTLLGTEKYQGFAGGLYPGGKNERPAAHEAAGLALAKQVRPLDAEGNPSDEGTIVLLSIGMSNTMQISQGFQQAFATAEGRNPRVTFVNGAQGGMTAQITQDPNDQGRGTQFWTTVDQRLQSSHVTRAQVQAIWIKQADAGPTEGFPGYAKKLEEELTWIVQLLPGRFPNLKLVYLSSRTYGGFAKSLLNPEPYAYESAFSVKWLVQRQIEGDPELNFDAKKGSGKAPWLSWGPYLWDNGVKPRPDGYRPEESDYRDDGTHHAGPGMEKMGGLLLKFFQSDSTTRPWFVSR